MENVVVPADLMWAVFGIAFIIQAARKILGRFSSIGDYNEFLPFVAGILGIIAAKITGIGFPDIIPLGIVAGFTASGLYDSLKALGLGKTEESIEERRPE